MEDRACKWEFEYAVRLEQEEFEMTDDTHPISSLSSTAQSQVHLVSSGVMTRQFLKGGCKIFQYTLDIPTKASCIGWAVGVFETLKVPSSPFAYVFCPVGMSLRAQGTLDFISKVHFAFPFIL